MSFKPLFVLFLSSHNAARSLIAETILNAKGSDRFIGRSAGLSPLDEVPPDTIALLQKAGYNTTRLRSKGVGEYLATAHLIKIDVIVTLSEEARLECPHFPQDPLRVHWAVDDPLSAPRADVRDWKYRKALATLETRITSLVRGKTPSSPEDLFLQLKYASMVV